VLEIDPVALHVLPENDLEIPPGNPEAGDLTNAPPESISRA
jgi:hypothetical protein